MEMSGSDRPGGWLPFAFALLSAVIAWPHAAWAQTSEAVDRSALRVCADPSNLPFSNRAGEGYENKIAELLAAELGVPVRYTWFPQVTGFVRNTLRARKCDLVMGVPLGFELLQNTNPYYRTSYSLVYRADTGLAVTALDDPAVKSLRMGVVAGTPPATLYAKYGLLGNTRSYHLMADTRYHNPSKQMIDDVAAGEIDVGALWGPIAGYHTKQHNPLLKVVPLASQPGLVRLDFRITMGLRFNEPEWKHQLNELIEKKQPEINAILLDYGVPLLDDQGQAITRPSE
jgi:quinoprotein dehydrogenase-associated probable ABC transporter substrate-binding protein